ncbi:MAG: hypothetical protein LBE71_05395 [Dysgonamonadaceae bacterium]|jgi:uncharacterized protein involved in exopolysaccharide biosynthesis|nr:hypothetical protein [Dysgonamonadaceae bacterium]
MNRENNSEKEQVSAFLLLCLKHWYYFVISIIICVALAVVYIKVKTPVWKITATVSLSDDDSFVKSGALSQSRSVMGILGMGGGGAQNVEDESKKMASHGYIKKMIQNLSLNVIYVQSKYSGIVKTNLYDRSPVIITANPVLPDTLGVLLQFVINVKKENETDIKLKMEGKTVGKYNITSFPAELETPAGRFTLFRSAYYDEYKKPFKIKALYTGYDYIAQLYMKEVEIDFEKKSSDLIHLTVNHENPVFAKRILKEVVHVYNSKWNESKAMLSEKTNAFIDERLKAAISDLSLVDDNIRSFKDKYKLTDIEADVTYYFEVNAKLQAQLIDAATQLKLIDIIFDFVNNANNKYSLVPFSTTTLDPSIAEVINKYNEALLTRNVMQLNSPRTTSILQSMDTEIGAQQENLLQSLANIKKGMQIALAELKSKEKEIDSRISNIPSVERQYRDMKREQEIQQTIYLFLVEKREETMLKSISLLPKLKIINEPYTVKNPVSPDIKKVALVVLFFGFLLPIVAIYRIPAIGRSFLRSRKK